MKKSQLQSIIREEVKAALGEAQSNPELDRTISQFVAGLAKKYDYQQSDAVLAIFEAMKRLGLINKDIDSYIVSRLSESAYAMLGGSNPLTDEAMKTKIVEPALGPNFETVVMMTNSVFNPRYNQLDAKFPRAMTDKWKVLYRSDSYQGYAKISPDGKVIKASVLGPGSIVGVFYVKSGAGINESKPLKLSEGAYQSANINELEMYLTLLYTTLAEEKRRGNTVMVKFLTMDIKEVKDALKSKGGDPYTLKEYTSNPFKAIVPGSGRPEIDPAFFAKLMPKSARTSKEAYARIQQWNGKSLSVHSQYFEVTPNGNMPNRPIYQLHQQQYGGGSNVTFLTIIDVTDKLPAGRGKDVGVCYVDTKVFLQEYKVVFQLLKSQS